MERLSQDFVIKLKYVHEKSGIFEFIIPNNTPTVDALDVLCVWQKVLLESLKPKKEEKTQETEQKCEGETCQQEEDHLDS